jgi:hypothetical protein
MTRGADRELLKPDIFDALSAAWVMACNDENPIITLRGLSHRLGRAEELDVRSIVGSRPELFRPGVSARLENWKREMLEGRHLPSWIREIEDGPRRDQTIRGLSADDVFRSQFRAEDGAARSSLETITWGLEHIDRLRKARFEAGSAATTRWQIWLIFGVGILNIVTTIAVALLKK